MPVSEYVTVSEAARQLHMSTARVRQLIADKQLSADKPAGSIQWLIRYSDLADFSTRNRPTGRPAKTLAHSS